MVLILTRWHHDDLAGRLLALDDGWQLLNISAKGETGQLGRDPGEFMGPARAGARPSSGRSASAPPALAPGRPCTRAAQVGGMIPVEPEGSKYARASAISPLVQAGNVFLPDPALARWVHELTVEAKDFPNAAHDDQVDALSQALHRLLLVPMIDGTLIDSDDFLSDEDDTYSGISPY